jgi:hypothetical protein
LIVFAIGFFLLSETFGFEYIQDERIESTSNKQLTWDDFKGEPFIVSDDYQRDYTTDAYIVTWLESSWSFNKTTDTTCKYKITKLTTTAYFLPYSSWINLDADLSDWLLKHETGHFNIAQIHKIKFDKLQNQIFECPTGAFDVDKINQDINGKFDDVLQQQGQMNEDYDFETDGSDIQSKQLEWNEKIASMLNAEATPTEESKIPAWIKNNAGWWADGSINDVTFLQGISYLIQNSIIVVPTTESGTGGGDVPDWVKNTAGWWADGTIDDGTFVNAIQYLIQQGLIQV